MDFFSTLVELLVAIRDLPARMRENSLVGESEMDRKSDGCFRKVFTGMIVIVVAVGLLLWWLIP